jgi:hypothetical protein
VCVTAAEAKRKEEEERKTKEEEEKKRKEEEARAAAAAAAGDEYVLHNRLVCSVLLCFRLSVCLWTDLTVSASISEIFISCVVVY